MIEIISSLAIASGIYSIYKYEKSLEKGKIPFSKRIKK